GIRRRVPTMLDGDHAHIRFLYSLLFTLPGTPVLLYGEEIGLGDDQQVPGRGAVRVAMQWTAGHAAGFTTGDPKVPLVTDGAFGPDRVNVAEQRRDPDSLLNWMERAIRARKELPEFGWGEYRVLDTDQPAVLAHRCDWHGGSVVALHNFGPNRGEVGGELGGGARGGGSSGPPPPTPTSGRTGASRWPWKGSATAGSASPDRPRGRRRRP